ncbi:biotin--[acetyl-CoA-carboxylase] ligase [Lactobacillus agrestimuris]|uniref:biotin--[acetyl-CoA-carboxylase] ligase n=1 Tax=Lactobacillus agrestimuris TaxID=2941328 RepID=UPI0020436871|nr:biotin--[acetyl-CoA-carboxylase] ligase [Lactobacillus agrestimuris]
MLIKVSTLDNIKVFHYDLVTSTQDLAKDYLEKNYVPAVFIADAQSSGYGKQGRKFYSPKDTGIYFSLTIPNFTYEVKQISLLTPYVALNLVKALEKFFPSINFKIKWVNDIYIANQKIAGILTEFYNGGLIIGVGININTTSFPSDLQKTATSITDDSFNKEKISSSLINATSYAVKNYNKDNFLDNYRAYSNILNQKIKFKAGNKLYCGRALEINDQGQLIVMDDSDHKKLTFSSGEITKIILN